jgi:hypothetical protein
MDIIKIVSLLGFEFSTQNKEERKMLKKLAVLLLLTVSISGIAKDTSVFRFSLCPGFGWPKDKNVTGLNLGLIGDQDKDKNVTGTDWSLLATLTEDVKGSQCSFINISKNSEFTQGGLVNVAENCKGTQWGFVNFGKDADGLQIGLINIMNNGWLPVFILFNFSK